MSALNYSPLNPTFGEQTIDNLLLLHSSKRIKLDPGFQRNSVWRPSDRRKLIESILAGYPLPSIFLYRRDEDGVPVYEVIDGKQRIETILMFVGATGFRGKGFDVMVDIGNEFEWHNWSTLKRCRPDFRASLSSFKLQTVEVTGDLSRIVDLFVRINSTGKSLTSGEKRNAQFYRSPFLRTANALVRKHKAYLLENRVFSPGQLDRMKGVELFSELLISIENGGPINKKKAIDVTIENGNINGRTLQRLTKSFARTLGLLKKMFPDLEATRFKNSAEFYSLFLLIWEMDQNKFILTDRSRNKIAFALLSELSTKVDRLRDQLRKIQPNKATEKLAQDYLLTIQGDTDSSANRQRRRQILSGILFSLFERKDERRFFSEEQRRILWNDDAERRCPLCKETLRWKDLSIDHKTAHARGGRTILSNAQLVHRGCNSKKGMGKN